ncbi:Peptidase M23 (plasmid) [Xylanimonas cellulosilytica DSM 15894]|uniref:Peptidase M23 n=1 Tax=Xylanimonas cellulosilytica (strain DSM 15894 / JCM 12276 / CECT 5975 / KCTC 9989 / LMG 20990 / NBRC 107835 / XIL07) TaxID=446471 RepID=D1C0X5_XYLCX|nr:peptidoglycan DD-metalloendopeptidase family protein [Xylanimonas cellulosilytica]ACZ32441.1 Peptidase M23 [Xylanimonas cellulosilytica DSM 15894]
MKKAVIVVIVLTVLAVPAAMFGLALMSVLTISGANAAQNACVAPIGSFASMGGPVRWPVVGPFTVTSEYGMRYNPGNIDHGEYRLHAGIDLASGTGPVVAAAAGIVSGTPTSATGGNIVEINHGGGLVTRYLHLTSRTVAVGDRVWAGRQIGIEGQTGNVSGVHLHFEVVTNGQPINPRGWLTQQGLVVPPTGSAGTAPAGVLVDPGGLTNVDTDPISLEPAAVGDSRPLVSALPSQVGAWQGDQVANAAQVIKAGQDRALDAKTITIAVMTAMAESSLQNLDHGDAVRGDTIGLFQEGPERGPYDQRMDPYGAANIFYDYLLRVPGYLDLEPTIAAHKAQANADPYHYAPRWPDAVQMVSTLTADPELLQNLPTTGPVTGCANGGPEALAGTGDGSGQAIIDAATHYLGTPYSWGGGTTTGPSLGTYTSGSLDGTHTVGFDCSGLVLFAVHHATGIELPHSAELQGTDPRGAVVARDWAQLQPGDVISFSEDGSGAPGSFGHVGIYIGDGKMIHAPRPGKTVEIVQLRGSTYYEPMAWSIRRYAN